MHLLSLNVTWVKCFVLIVSCCQKQPSWHKPEASKRLSDFSEVIHMARKRASFNVTSTGPEVRVLNTFLLSSLWPLGKFHISLLRTRLYFCWAALTSISVTVTDNFSTMPLFFHLDPFTGLLSPASFLPALLVTRATFLNSWLTRVKAASSQMNLRIRNDTPTCDSFSVQTPLWLHGLSHSVSWEMP